MAQVAVFIQRIDQGAGQQQVALGQPHASQLPVQVFGQRGGLGHEVQGAGLSPFGVALARLGQVVPVARLGRVGGVFQRRRVQPAGALRLQLACLALFEAGDEVLMPDPSYPCNRHFVAAAGAKALALPAGPEQRFQLDADTVAARWTPNTRAVLLASPSNPTGTSIAPGELGRIVTEARARGGLTLVDEIYLGLSYDDRYAHSALALGEDVISINSFSKYFNMTGWRLGWLVVPPTLVAPIEKLQQNLYICASSIAQHAALACFEAESLAVYEQRRQAFRERRDFIVGALNEIGLTVPVMPDGAFYAWADCSRFSNSSWDFCMDLMQQAHVALTPGRDFGPAAAERYLRLSFASSLPQLQEAAARLSRFVST
ncbi:aminotransferase class I/II-fold pyridoxal phosphate-dependent enzyme [Ideonella azotifigens]|uniref:aminotransferase class I/II-fold pyridoxal phosphate-dependent enzyme n=1 Tax=Ideonella azotifigens TaxID=513160 RepID=UPI001F466B76